ncbi:MAG: hypothetical protein MRY21_07950 [Simkaniaceae bacterium]|nr:hypothetical protein [Simkaniaceae bacterium]
MAVELTNPICNNTPDLTFRVSITNARGQGTTNRLTAGRRIDLYDFLPRGSVDDPPRTKYRITIWQAGEIIARSLKLERGFYVALLKGPRVMFYPSKEAEKDLRNELEKGEMPPHNDYTALVRKCYDTFIARDPGNPCIEDKMTFFNPLLCYSPAMNDPTLSLSKLWVAYKTIAGLPSDLQTALDFSAKEISKALCSEL